MQGLQTGLLHEGKEKAGRKLEILLDLDLFSFLLGLRSGQNYFQNSVLVGSS